MVDLAAGYRVEHRRPLVASQNWLNEVLPGK
jgi:hypothetical protein